jgi:hypothetical protein
MLAVIVRPLDAIEIVTHIRQGRLQFDRRVPEHTANASMCRELLPLTLRKLRRHRIDERQLGGHASAGPFNGTARRKGATALGLDDEAAGFSFRRPRRGQAPNACGQRECRPGENHRSRRPLRTLEHHQRISSCQVWCH